MKRLSILLLALILAGCSMFSPTGVEDVDDFRVPLVCSPEHTQLPCTGGVEEGVAYRFNLLTHCGIEWAYFNGHYWVPKPMVDAPSDWGGYRGWHDGPRAARRCCFRSHTGSDGSLRACTGLLPSS
jgi:hypothetical protein